MNGRPPELPPHKLLSSLRAYDLLPAIVFLPTRRKCDEAAMEVSNDKSQKTSIEKQELRHEIFDEFVGQFPEIRKHKHAKLIVNSGVASHHAGHMPAWKLLIEKLMSGGLLNAIFATSTVAAGVDFPARTVVISNADTRGNDGWRPLSASELQQMTGRAGRRGKDNVGFVVLVPGQFQNPKKIAELLTAPPDPLESRFRATYTSLLNLLDAFKNFEQLREIAEKSFAFQSTSKQVQRIRLEVDRLTKSINQRIGDSGLSLDDVRGFERLVSSRNRLDEKIPATRIELRHDWLRENVIAGRLVTQGRNGKRFFMVFSVHGDKVSAMRDDGGGTSFPLSRVTRIYKDVFPLKEAAIEHAFLAAFDGKIETLTEPKVSFKKNEMDDASAMLNAKQEEIVGRVSQQNQQLLWGSFEDAERLEKHASEIDFLRNEIWLPFERRAKVLDHFGYVDFDAQNVTESGKWLADVRVDRPLLVGEALRLGIFDDIEPRTAAGLMASLAADSDRDYGELYLSDELLDVVNTFEEIILAVSNVEWKAGIEPTEEINLSAAAAAEHWTAGMPWDELVRRTRAEEGDLVRLLSRTGEALMQIAFLKASNPKASAIARETAEIILREPVR
ncbi:MAG: hypothetical protein ACT4O9_01550 [Blastocatellia bacterium]